jgi:hypothetical protein
MTRFSKSFLVANKPLSFGLTEDERQLFPDAGLLPAQMLGGNISSYPLGWWNYGGKDKYELWNRGTKQMAAKKLEAGKTMRQMMTPIKSRYVDQSRVAREKKLRSNPEFWKRKEWSDWWWSGGKDQRAGEPVTYAVGSPRE